MKKHINLLEPLIILCLIISSLHVRAADDPAIEKRKSYSKSYTINNNEKISVRNQFGEVKVTTWNKNEIKVDVTIISKSSTDERAQEILDRITIEDGKNSDGVYYKTNIKNSNKNSDHNNYREEKMEINYVVSMPVSNPLNLENQFGATIVPDLNGAVNLSSKFGSLTTGKLPQSEKINVEFGSASIQSMNSGILIVKFSRAIVDKLDGSVTATFEHCSGVKLGIQNSTRELRVQNNFTKLYLDLNQNLSASFEINTNFGELTNTSGLDIKEEGKENNRGPNFRHRYLGKSGNGDTAMKIQSEFGNIVLGHNLSMDLKEDKKETKKTTSI